MALTADQITALNFHDYHQMILPYLNGQGLVNDTLYSGSLINDNTAQLSKPYTDYKFIKFIFAMDSSGNNIFEGSVTVSEITSSKAYFFNNTVYAASATIYNSAAEIIFNSATEIRYIRGYHLQWTTNPILLKVIGIK